MVDTQDADSVFENPSQGAPGLSFGRFRSGIPQLSVLCPCGNAHMHNARCAMLMYLGCMHAHTLRNSEQICSGQCF